MAYCDFGWALEKLRAGLQVARSGWNGKNMWIKMQSPDAHSKMGRAYLYMCCSDGALVPWVASHSDLLEADWVEVK